MQSYEWTIKDPIGIHARPAGLLVKEASQFECDIKVSLNDKSANAKGILGLMQLGAACGDTLLFEFDGADEADAKDSIAVFLEINL